ncbi:peptidylprolyl isomerase [Porphyromonas cangingivalis]|uniref:Periplasmic chaperone PpiD n=2 Tax=Porphyromonas cangingivalis TaxID=36874 RepID=A0A1T4NK76_PORCN|nr:peptidylprolyl isomerase [Porphyromonas cangingivalis]SJZ79417.1 peptidyl-prolyl cis-trans isomerase D [Porphyromonas cangingivalis]VEJ03559.1 Peptidyl-prolyl cis-trans isomerase surA [Porphyromonas cangingivalis]
MATLEKIRNRAGLLVIIIGLALLAFLMGDFLRQGTTLFRDSQMNAIVVDGEVVKINEYEARVNQAQELYRMQSGNNNLSDVEMNQLRNQVYTSIVSEHVLDAKTKQLGISVSPAEVFDLVQGDFISPVVMNSPLFVDGQTGVFDKVALLNFLKGIDPKQINSYGPAERDQALELRNIWIAMENNIHDFRLNEKYTNLISKAMVANKLEIEDYVAAGRTTADLALVSRAAMTAPDSIATVTDAALKAFYDGHKEAFKTDEGRTVDVVYATIAPSQADIDATFQDVETARRELIEGVNANDVISEFSDEQAFDAYLPLSFFRNAFFNSTLADELAAAEPGHVTDVNFSDNTYSVAKLLGTKVAPDSLLVRHILLQPGDAAIDSLFNAAKGGIEAFSNVAVNHSLDNRSGANGGELGWFTEFSAGRFISPEFRDAIFSATVGTPVKFTSQYGAHILLVEKATAPVKKYNVAYVTKKATPSSRTIGDLYNEMNTFLTKNNNPVALDTAALVAGYQTLKDLPVYAMQPNLANSITNSRELVRWALNNKVGAISEVKECGDKYVIAVVKKVYPRGYVSLADAKEQIQPAVLNLAKIDAMYNQLKAGNYASLEAYSQAVDMPVDSINFVKFDTNRLEGVGFEPALNAAATYAPLNTLTPVKGNNGVYLVNVISRNSDADTVTPEAARGLIETSRQAAVRARALQWIILRSDVEDTRVRFY